MISERNLHWHTPCEEECLTGFCNTTAATMRGKLQDEIDPCFDFHRFACGRSGGSDHSSSRSVSFLDMIVAAPPQFQFIKDFYYSCTHNITYGNDTDTINEDILPEILDRPLYLVGGRGEYEGNVMVNNSEGYIGPICDDSWDIAAVSVLINKVLLHSGPIHYRVIGGQNRVSKFGVKTSNELFKQDMISPLS